jgi:hypothetical protein
MLRLSTLCYLGKGSLLNHVGPKLVLEMTQFGFLAWRCLELHHRLHRPIKGFLQHNCEIRQHPSIIHHVYGSGTLPSELYHQKATSRQELPT